MAISRQKEARSREYALLLFRMTSRFFYSAQYHRQHCTLHAFEQFGTLHMHNHDDKYPARPGFEPGTSRLQAPVNKNEPYGPASKTRNTHPKSPALFLLTLFAGRWGVKSTNFTRQAVPPSSSWDLLLNTGNRVLVMTSS